jgi:hypothetical protein
MYLARITIEIPSDVNEEFEDQYLNEEIGKLCSGQKHNYPNYRRLVKVEHVSSSKVVIYYESTDKFKVPSGMELRVNKKKNATVDTTERTKKVLASGGKGGKGLGDKSVSS